MNGWDLFLLLLLAAAVGLALRTIHRSRQRGSGCPGCAGGCAGCTSSCHKGGEAMKK